MKYLKIEIIRGDDLDLYMVRKKLNMGVLLTSIELRVTDYARVSTDHLEQKKSLQNQVEHFSEYIKSNSNWTYIEGYVDDGITGTSDVKRDNFMKMIEDARRGKFDLIVTKEISRFSRNTLDSIKYTRLLLSYGVAVFFVNDNINTALPDSELRLTIMASMAQDEVRRLSERVKFGMNRAINRGEILGNDMLYGYRKDRETGVLRIVYDEALVVERIFQLYSIEKLSLSCIVRIFNDEGIRTREGKKWSVATVSRMIENPKYKGYYCGRKSEIIDYMTKKIKYFDKDEWVVYEDKVRIPCIVSEEIWKMANERLNRRKKSFKKKSSDKEIYRNRYLYSAKIYCMVHNKSFHRREFRREKKDVTWVCSEYLKNGKKSCDTPNVREEELYYIFNDLISKLEIKLDRVVSLLMNYYKNEGRGLGIDEKIDNLRKDKEKIIDKKKKVLDLVIEGSLVKEEFKEKNNELSLEMENIDKKIEVLIEDKNKDSGKNLECLEEYITKLVNSRVIKERVIGKIIDRIGVFKVNDDNRNIGLNVFLDYNGKGKLLGESNYEFKRGYDTRGTKRYVVNYWVKYYVGG